MERYLKIRRKQIGQEAVAWANANPGFKGEWMHRRAGFINGAKWYDSIYPNKLTPERLTKAKEEFLSAQTKGKEPKGVGFEAGANWANSTPPRMKQLDLFEKYDD